MTAFDDIAGLRRLAFRVEKVDEFISAYKQLMNSVATEMHRVRNTDLLLAGYYRLKIEVMRRLAEKQAAFIIHGAVPGNATNKPANASN